MALLRIACQSMNKPDLVVDLSYAQDLACEDLTEVDFALSNADPAAPSDPYGSIMEWICRVWRRFVDPS